MFFKAVVEWVKHDFERQIYFDDLFDLIKLEKLKTDFLANSVAQEVSNLWK